MCGTAREHRERHWVIEVAAIEWRRWRSFIKVVAFYAVTITAGCLWVASEFDASATFFQERGINFGTVITAPLGAIQGVLLLPLIAAYAIRRHALTAIVSLAALATWFYICLFALYLAT